MKKSLFTLMLAVAATMIMSITAAAQDDNQQSRPERNPADKTEIVKKRTAETVESYGLNEEQAQKLLDLNTRYADKMGPRMGRRPDGQPGRGPRPGGMKRGERPQSAEGNDNAPSADNGSNAPHMRGNASSRESMRKTMEEYDAELQKIMTDEQFKRYQADRQKRFQQQQQGRRGNGDGKGRKRRTTQELQ